MTRSGQYFTIDAFAAMLVIATGLILVFALNTYGPSVQQPASLSQEFVNALAQTKIRELNNAFITEQVRGGNITDYDNTLLQQAYEFKQYNHRDFSVWLLANVTKNLVPVQYNFEILIDGDVMYGRGSGQDETDLLVSSKRIVFGIVNKTVEFWGPITVEVRVWQ